MIFQLYYLSIKYKVTDLTTKIYDHISKNNQKLVIELLNYKIQIQNLPNYDELKLNFEQDNEINLISSNLIYFITNDKDNFSSLPINILYSIFSKYFEQNEFRIEISNFLFDYLDNSDKNAPVLLSLIKFNNIDDLISFEEKLIQLNDKFSFNFLNCESIAKTHFFDRKSLKDQLQKKDKEITQLKDLIKEKDDTIEKQNYHNFEFDESKPEDNNGICHFLAIKQANKQNKFDKDPEFVVSLSSADKFSVISPEKKEIKGLISCVHANKSKMHSFSIELENKVEAELLKIQGFNNGNESNIPHSFSYKINDDDEEFVSNDKLQMFHDKDESKRIYCIPLNGKTPIKKITFYPKNDVSNQDTWPIFQTIELFKSKNDSKSIFESLIEEREDKDPHRCGVFIYTSIYDFNNFYDLNNKELIITLGENNPYFKYEITKGYAILTGYRFKKAEWNVTTQYRIIVTDNDKKNDEDWTCLYETPNGQSDDKLLDCKKFEKSCPPIRFIKLIQKEHAKLKNGGTSRQFAFFHIEFFGHLIQTP